MGQQTGIPSHVRHVAGLLKCQACFSRQTSEFRPDGIVDTTIADLPMKQSLLVPAILLVLLPAWSAATTCIRDEGRIAELSEKHHVDVKFDIHKSGNEFDVYVYFPRMIDGLDFTQVNLYLVNEGIISFMGALAAGPNGEMMHAAFVVGSDVAPTKKIQIVYGSPCELLLEYDIPLAEAEE